jgi:tol-pal system protein YbgF
MSRSGRMVLFSLAGALVATTAHAQLLRPPSDLRDGETGYRQAQSQDAAGLMVRLDRAESQLRSQTGQIEQMQFQIKRLEDQLRKFQEDVDFRFQDAGGARKSTVPAARPPVVSPPVTTPGRRTELNENGYPAIGQTSDVAIADPAPSRVSGVSRPGRRGDAFDPDVDPLAPGAPRPLGETPSPSAPPRVIARAPASSLTRGPIDDGTDPDLDREPGAPMDLMRGPSPRGPSVALGVPPATAPRVLGGELPPATPIALPPTTRDELNAGVAALKGGQYEVAEEGFRTFLQKHPRDRLAADATFYLAESYYKRQRSREAAEQYLKVSTDYDKSAKAPEALLKLGLSLEKLGAREQACAAYGEVGRKYPNASVSLKASAERESKRSQC